MLDAPPPFAHEEREVMSWNDTYRSVKERRPDIFNKVFEVGAVVEFMPEGTPHATMAADAEAAAMAIVCGLLDEMDALRRGR